MITKLKISGLILIAIGVVSIYVLDNDFLGFPAQTATIPVNETAWVELPITMQYISGENITDGVREKRITVGDTEIQFTVGVEKGIEETPSPGVLRALNEAGYYKPISKIDRGPIMGSIDMSRYSSKIPSGYDPVIELDLTELLEMTKIHRYDKLKKAYIDETFTCDNYKELAWKFAGENMWAVGYGDVEDYIFAKAINECINPNHQEELDKVHEELEKVNADE